MTCQHCRVLDLVPDDELTIIEEELIATFRPEELRQLIARLEQKLAPMLVFAPLRGGTA